MSDEARKANAAAKAAKAEAKALRPWYKKKRWWLAAVVVIGIAAGSSGGDSSTNSSTGSGSSDSGTSGKTEDTISSGLGSKNAIDDIVKLSCGSPDALDFSYPEVKVTNKSSKSSNYSITVVYESSDGSTKYGDSMILITSLKPGQTMTETGLPVSGVKSGAVCKVTEVQRTAA